MRILVFQHLEVEHPGIFREFWTDAGHQLTVVELDAGEAIPRLDNFDLLVVMGGPMDVWQEDIYAWLAPEKAAIRHWVQELGRPYLGICLGHQLLAEAMGGKVSLMAAPEVGLAVVKLTPEGASDPVLSGFPADVETFQWHGAEVSRMPPGAVLLASNAACPVQAFRWGPHAYGFQYHVEITETTVSDWERIPAYKASLINAMGADKASRLGEVVNARLADFRTRAQCMNSNFWSLLAPSRQGS